jgi:TolB-like protein/Tfp pilus assembly protein PilF
VTVTPTEREGDGAWGMLRRRKVVQWGIAYAAGAWGLLQGLQFLAGAFEWPTRVLKLSTIALLVGLPIVLVLAWYHGDRGEQRLRATEFIVVSLLFLLGGGLLWRYQSASEESPAATTQAAAPVTAATPADARPSIAVLPFENRSRLEDDVFFVDGIHDDILTQLSKVSALKVISRTSVERFRDTTLPIKSIAEQLGVTKILEGGVQRAGDRVRITVQLIDANTDAHLWAETYDRELTAANIFSIQSEVAAAISGALRATLTTAERNSVNAVPTQNLQAWEAYQLGKQRMARRTSAGLSEAEKYFQKAIDLDPQFALAYAGLADTLVLQVDYALAPGATTLQRADDGAERALQLDPGLAEAWTSSAMIARLREQYDRADPMFLRAIGLNPNYATAHHWYSRMLGDLGRGDDALTQAQRAVELDPLSAIINKNMADRLQYLGRFQDAVDRYRKAIEIDPLMPSPYVNIGLLKAYALNRIEDGVPFIEEAISLDPGSPDYAFALAMVLLDLGDDARATRAIQSAQEHWPSGAGVNLLSAEMYQYRGDQEASGRYARTALEIAPQSGRALALLSNVDMEKGDYNSARARYAKAYPELVTSPPPKIDRSNCFIAVDLALVLQKTGERERARLLLDRSWQVIPTIPLLGPTGSGPDTVRVFALRGQKREALSALRAAVKAGWRIRWRYYRDFDPALASIRDDPEFKAAFAVIERDMAAQRAQLAARPKDAPLDLGESRK